MPPKLKKVKLSEFRPAAINPNAGNQDSIPLIRQSIEQTKAGRPMLSDKDGEMIGGSHSLQAFLDAGYEEALVVEDDGSLPIIYKRIDVLIDSDVGRAMQIGDNVIGAKSYTPDDLVIANLIQDMRDRPELVKAAGFDEPDIDKLIAELTQTPVTTGLYTRKIETPIYTPKDSAPPIDLLVDDRRTQSLLIEIDQSPLPEHEKAFLRVVAQRHTVLHFARIADYYAQASSDMQRLMEDSALVIIDYDRAVELGFVQLSQRLSDLYEDDYAQ